MKTQEKLSLIFWIFILFCMLGGLTGCSTVDPSTAITDSIKQDVKVIEKQVATVKENLPVNCKTSVVISQLDIIQGQIKTISTKADTVELSCKTEKEVYTQQISKLRIIIGFLILVIVGGIILKVRKNWN